MLRSLPRYGLNGLGKTFIGSEHVASIAKDDEDIIVVCQKSKVCDWVEHWRTHYRRPVCDYTRKDPKNPKHMSHGMVTVVNYDLLWRRPIFKEWRAHLILDESSMIQNESTKRTKFVLSMHPLTVTLLSGTPVSGKYENLWSQIQLLGWKLPKQTYWDNYVRWHSEVFYSRSFPVKIVDGYKNVDMLKEGLRKHGAVFMRADEAVTLPDTVENTIKVRANPDYRKFMRDRLIVINGEELVGDTPLTTLLRARQLCGIYAVEKMDAMADILASTHDKVVIFYNFKAERAMLETACHKAGRKPYAICGEVKQEREFHESDDGVLLVQYTAGSMGLNLQDCNRIVYYTPPLSCDLFMQSKARIRRIGQKRTCFYTYLVVEGSIEEHIYEVLARKEDYTLDLFLTEDNHQW